MSCRDRRFCPSGGILICVELLTLILGAGFAITFALLVRSLFRQAGIQDALKETSDASADQLKLWEEFGQHLDDGVALVSEKDEIVYANQAFAELVGWPHRSSFHQQLDSILALQDPEAKPANLPTGKSALLYIISKDGRRSLARVARRPLSRPEGFGVVVLHDASSEEAEKQMRNRLVNLSSFELRAPITAMKGYASMLLDGDAGKLPHEVITYLEPILEGSEKLLTIIDDMAHVEALSTHKLALKKVLVPASEMIAEHAKRLGEIAKQAGHNLQVSEGNVRPKIEVDSQQIGRLLTMMTNTAARTASPNSDVMLSVQEQDRTVDIHLQNEGPPLPKQNQANVFDYAGGHGLDEGIGFYVAQQIIEGHHAFVTVNTKPNGNDFVLSLPKIKEAAPTTATESVEEALAADEPKKDSAVTKAVKPDKTHLDSLSKS